MTRSSAAMVHWECPEAGTLLDCARAGDAEAFCELCKIHERGLLRQAMTLSGNAALAEDLTQDTLVEAWRNLRRYNGSCRFFTWLCAILINRYRNALRERRMMPIADSPGNQEGFAEGINELRSEEVEPDQEAQRKDQAAMVRRCVEALPPKHQQVVHLRFFVDDSLQGIAAALGCSVGTVKSRLFHALEKLRTMRGLDEHPGNLKGKPDTYETLQAEP